MPGCPPMSHARRMRGASLAALALLAAWPAAARAQAAVQPTNDHPNPYRTIEGWAKMPEGRTWGSTSAVGSAQDCACPGGSAQARPGAGPQVYQFSPDGKLLMTLGKAGGAKGAEYFYQPNDVLVAPNGDIYVADGHSSADTANARLLKFSNDGTLLASWGKKGSGPGEFDQPHALAMDSRGRLFVGDRSNNRIQILDQNGNFLAQWFQFSRPSGLAIDRNDVLYVADSESGSVAPSRPAWKRGMQVRMTRDV